MGLGYRFTELVLPKLERTQTNIVKLPSDGFDWLIIACIVESFTDAPSLNFIVKDTIANQQLIFPIVGTPDWTINIGPFIPTEPSTWVQTFGSINHFDVSHGLEQFVTRFPLTENPELVIEHNNDNPIVYSIGVVMGRGS